MASGEVPVGEARSWKMTPNHTAALISGVCQVIGLKLTYCLTKVSVKGGWYDVARARPKRREGAAFAPMAATILILKAVWQNTDL